MEKKSRAGRPLTAGELRLRKTLRATAEEWQMHLDFDKIIKYGNKQAAIDFIAQYKGVEG